MLPYRYPSIFISGKRCQANKHLCANLINEINADIFPPEIEPFTPSHVERITLILQEVQAMIMPGSYIDDFFCVFYPSMSGKYGLYGSDYSLLYAYSRIYLHNLGLPDKKMILLIDRSTEFYEEINCQHIGLNRIDFAYDYVDKILLIAPTSIISEFEFIISRKWIKKIFNFTKLDFDKKLPQSIRIPQFGGSKSFDHDIWISSQKFILKGLKIYASNMENFLNILSFIDELKDQLLFDKSNLEKIKKDLQQMDQNTLPNLSSIEMEIEIMQSGLQALILYGNTYTFIANDIIVGQKIINTINKILQKISKKKNELLKLIADFDLHRIFGIWINSRFQAANILDQKSSLHSKSIDKDNLLELIDECEYLIAFVATSRSKSKSFECLCKNFTDVSDKIKILNDKELLFEQKSHDIKYRIIQFASQNECNDTKIIEKLHKFYISRPRQTLVDFKNLKFFKKALSTIEIDYLNNSDDEDKNIDPESQHKQNIDDSIIDFGEILKVDNNLDLQTNSKNIEHKQIPNLIDNNDYKNDPKVINNVNTDLNTYEAYCSNSSHFNQQTNQNNLEKIFKLFPVKSKNADNDLISFD